MGQYVTFYCSDNNRELKKIVNPILMSRFGWLAQKDYDDFYSLAGQVVWDCERKFEAKEGTDKNDKGFKDFLTVCIQNKIKSQLTYMHRKKRVLKDGEGHLLYDISIDMQMGADNKGTLGDTLQSDFDIDTIVLENNGCQYSSRMNAYLKSLTPIQRQLAEMVGQGVSSTEIKEKLGLNNRQYHQNYKALTSFEHIKILNDETTKDKEAVHMSMTTQTMENCKTDKISISSVIKRIEKNTIRFNHPLQRESDQWSPAMKGNLISDILQGNRLHPLIFAEQIINGVPIIWDLDGKQRCTNAYTYAKNGFKVSKNIRRWRIKYQTTKKDRKGKEILDENGFPIAQNEEFDIRGKRFSDLPEELQEKFMDYTFNYDQYLNCSEEDIGYHIERYNDGKPMTAAQKGITKLGTEYAEMVKSISNMRFFKDMGGYKVSEFKNGTINRVVVEAVMAANFIEDWKKEQDSQCKYLKENADISVFDNFEDMVGRLERVVTDDVSEMFDSKDSFLYFGLFARFMKTGLEDKRFIEFMAAFSRTLHSKRVNGITYDELCIDKKTGKPRSTKDKYIVIPKMELLERLMYEFLHVKKVPIQGRVSKGA